MKIVKISLTIILIPVAIFIWYDVFQLISIEMGNGDQEGKTTVVQQGINLLSAEAGGTSRWYSLALMVVGVLAIVVILMVGKNKKS